MKAPSRFWRMSAVNSTSFSLCWCERDESGDAIGNREENAVFISQHRKATDEKVFNFAQLESISKVQGWGLASH